MRRPDFVIVGAPKSATTYVYRALMSHPQVFIPRHKEPHFFGRDLTKYPNPFFVLDEAAYLKLFEGARPDQRVGEASVNYLMSQSAPSEIRAFNPEMRILVLLRDPVEMLYAYHSQLVFGVFEDIADFEDALEAEPERRRGERIPPYCMMPESLFYSEVANYPEQVERYFDVFGRDRVEVVLYDDFKADVAGTLRRIYGFLDVDPDHVFEAGVVNPNTAHRSAWLQGLTWRPPGPIAALLARLPDRWRMKFLYGVVRLNTRAVPRQPLPESVAERLRTRFAPGIARLGVLLERDLSHWVKS